MQTNRTYIFSCPFCGTSFQHTQGNHQRHVFMRSDGKLCDSLYSRQNAFECGDCGNIVWLTDVLLDDELDEFSDKSSEYMSIPRIKRLDSEGFKRAIASLDYDNDLDAALKEKLVRIEFWHHLNDSASEAVEDADFQKYLAENLGRLIPLLNTSERVDKLLCAEAYRELHQFAQAIELLNTEPCLAIEGMTILDHALTKQSTVFPIPQGEDEVNYLRKKVAAGDKNAMYILGGIYIQGEKSPIDAYQGVALIQQAADQGHVWAASNLGNYYLDGFGCEKSRTQAIKYYQIGADQGDDVSQFNLSLTLANDSDTNSNPAEAFKYCQLAANQGLVRAMNKLARWYETGFGCAKDLAESFKWDSRSAEAGSAVGLNNLGLCYTHGWGTEIDLDAAFDCLNRAASAGSEVGYYNLALAYEKGRGTEIDLHAAEHYYLLAANKDHAPSMCNLARLYESGIDGNPDGEAVIAWYQRAAENGYAMAEYQLGLLFESGEIAPYDLDEAIKWFELAAEHGQASAVEKLAFYNFLDENDEEIEIFEDTLRRAEEGDPDSQYQVALLYLDGVGTRENVSAAIKWMKQSAENGNVSASEHLDRLTTINNDATPKPEDEI